MQQAVERTDIVEQPKILSERTRKVLDLSMKLSSIPSVSVPPSLTNFEAINEAHNTAKEFAISAGLNVMEMRADEEHPYPYLVIGFNEPTNGEGAAGDKVALVGHLDVVSAQTDSQFSPRIDGDMLIGRGTADMKTVVATQLVWMAEQQKKEGPKPPIVLMLSSCEENGSVKPYGTQHAIQMLQSEHNIKIELAIVGERTGEMESINQLSVGPICDRNRGWRWYRGSGMGVKGLQGLKLIAEMVKGGRTWVNVMNTEEGWNTGFVNSFAGIEADEESVSTDDTEISIISRKGEAKHAASISAEMPTLLEDFYEIAKLAQQIFGEENVKLTGIEIGDDGNFNTVTGGGKMALEIKGLGSGLKDFLEKISSYDYSSIDIHKKLSSQNGHRSSRMEKYHGTIFGLDIREIPAQTSDVNAWLENTRQRLQSAGIEMETVNEGDGWVCPPNNNHLEKLISAYEEVTSRSHKQVGKLHGNDGRFFEGNAVVFGQIGQNPHGPNEAHYIPSIETYMQVLDAFASKY
ncbi:M20/M25/M40 family metallo-hydrolase [Candidatus Peregrinibacteria bacterium]|nr:M20/M25/M40 family metallo-hydrolase [Candidatus Peregrinibacteria bacterium]